MIYTCPHCKKMNRLTPISEIMLRTSKSYTEKGKVEALATCSNQCNTFVLTLERARFMRWKERYGVRKLTSKDNKKDLPIVNFVATSPLINEVVDEQNIKGVK